MQCLNDLVTVQTYFNVFRNPPTATLDPTNYEHDTESASYINIGDDAALSIAKYGKINPVFMIYCAQPEYDGKEFNTLNEAILQAMISYTKQLYAYENSNRTSKLDQ